MEVVARPELALTADLINQQIQQRQNGNHSSGRGNISGRGGRSGRGSSMQGRGRTMDEIKDLLRALGLQVSGTKAVIEKRLEEALDAARKKPSGLVVPLPQDGEPTVRATIRISIQVSVSSLGLLSNDWSNNKNLNTVVLLQEPSSSGNKRFPCAISECEEFCESVHSCNECPVPDNIYHYCTLHIAHSSHSQQFGSQRKHTAPVSTDIDVTTTTATGPTASIGSGIVDVVSIETTANASSNAGSIVVATVVTEDRAYKTTSPTRGSVIADHVVNAASSNEKQSSSSSSSSSEPLPTTTTVTNDTADAHIVVALHENAHWSLEEIDTYLQDNKSTMGSLLKIHHTIQASIASEQRKDIRSRDYYGRLFTALNYSSYGRQLVDLNNTIYHFTNVPDYGSVESSVVKNPLSKQSVRESYLRSFCQACIDRFVQKI